MIFGMAVFAEPTFADIGEQVSLNRDWNKLPGHDCASAGWTKIDVRFAESEKLEKGDAEWTIIK